MATRMRSSLLLGTLMVGALLSPILIVGVQRWIVDAIGERIDWAGRRLAGKNARDCGRVSSDGDAREASNCVVTAVRERKAFRVLYDVPDVDYVRKISLVGDADGHVYELYASSSGSSPVFGGDVEMKRCREPVTFGRRFDMWSSKDRGMIYCFGRFQ